MFSCMVNYQIICITINNTMKILIPIYFDFTVSKEQDGNVVYETSVDIDDVDSQIIDFLASQAMGDPKDYSEYIH